MRFVFILNPVSGKGTNQNKIINEVNGYFSQNNGVYKIIQTKFPGEAKQIANEEAKKGDEVCIFACGGEGTSFEVVNGIVGYDNACLGVIPCGSANDFLKFFKNRSAFFDIADQAKGGKIKMDLIKAGDCYCLNGCSVGMDAMVARDMVLFKRLPFVKGSLAYNLAIVKNFLSKIGVTMNIKVDDENLGKNTVLFALVANAPFYGGGYIGAPNAVPYDCKLNFTMVDKISRFKIPSFLLHYKKGTQGSLKICKMKECSSLHITADSALPVNLDGEIITTNDIKFEIAPQALNFWLPESLANKLLTKV